MSYKKIVFGKISAEAEISADPDLIKNGFLDYRNSIEKITSGEKFVVLGYKGAGKSTIGEYINQNLSDRYDAFVKLVALGDFPFKPFSKIIRGEAEHEAKYPTAWSWIILIYLLESFIKDQSLTHPNMAALQSAMNAMRDIGLSPAADPATIVRISSRRNFKLSIPKVAETSWDNGRYKDYADIPDFVAALKELFSDIKTDNMHYLVIDGLDDILTGKEVQFESLAALLFEVQRLNVGFKRQKIPAKIIILCRTDIFELLPGPNKNKLKQDFAIDLDWFHDPKEPEKSDLFKIAQIRTNRSLGESKDFIKEFFPEFVDRDISPKFLLEMTRHTPRDFLRLLTYIQDFCGDNEKLTSKMVTSGARDYSIKYFLPEIRDELSGYVDADEIDSLVKALGSMGRRDFSANELVQECQNGKIKIGPDRVYDILGHLFECSAVGNIQKGPDGVTRYTFKYRNRNSSFNEGLRVILHKGLWKALNLA